MFCWQFIPLQNVCWVFPPPYYELTDSRHIVFIAICTLQQGDKCLNWILRKCTSTFSLCFFGVIALLRYNLYTLPLIHLKYTIQWFLVYSELGIYHHNFRTFSLCPKEALYPLAITIPPPITFYPPQPAATFDLLPTSIESPILDIS